jgi:hypothetical protein
LPVRALLERDFERFRKELPGDVAAHVRETYRIDLTARYLGFTLPHPIGKGSGQLSLNQEQLETDRAAGLAFAVLKTVIAEDSAGRRAMEAWAIHETRMRVEKVRSGSGLDGWTVTWKGRGWDRSFEDYLDLVRAAGELTRSGGMLVIPSAKYHLPRMQEQFREDEYRHTTRRVAEAWGGDFLALEKDFSPTLAGDSLADDRERILRWLREVPELIRTGAGRPVRLALKLMNARHGEPFQREMVEAAAGADALVCFNRLWSEARGAAYGGYDLSDRNLRTLEKVKSSRLRHPPLSGTGNVSSGRMILEYAKLGCESVQLHTFFQLPLSEYPATAGSRTQRALHALVFHPESGLIAGLLDLEQSGRLHRKDGELRFLDVAAA